VFLRSSFLAQSFIAPSWRSDDVLQPPQPVPGGGYVVAMQRPVEPARANEILLLLAAQIAIGTVH
jgi:hypothetical protein